MRDVVITDQEAGQRFDRFLRKRCRDQHDIGLGDIYAWIRKGACRINGQKKKEDYRLCVGDTITRKEHLTELSPHQVTLPKQQKINSYHLDKIRPLIIYEDENRIVWNKPAGIVTHPGKDHTTDMSFHDIMQSYLAQTGQKAPSETFHPAFCFRLDKDTSGIIISAKTYPALQWLNEQIRERKVDKKYLAVVAGNTPATLHMDSALTKGYDTTFGVGKMQIDTHAGKASLTTAKTLKHINHPRLGRVSLLEVTLHTGRMHQIRTHLTHAGYPILGDLMYGNPVINRLAKKEKISRQLLHSVSYSFFDPFARRQQTYTTEYPEDFTRLLPYGN